MAQDESYRFDGRLDQALAIIARERSQNPEATRGVAPITNAIRAHVIARSLPVPVSPAEKLLAGIPFEPMA